ncbi:serine hydrolase domain-containing protein [Saccharothrix saharensis]|uniref:serine hydrolase domain-containing protein n=1 Tax=Saccharothrix saharensis TaxID=571190 RepID=UPI0036775112
MVRPDEWPEVLTALERQAGWRHPSPDRVDLADLMRLYDVPAVSVAVRQDGAGHWAGGFGAGPGTLFQAASISEHVAAFGTLRLVDQGVLDLDEDVDAYLTSWRVPETGGRRVVITLRRLLAHTAGLTSNWFRGFRPDEPLPTLRQVLAGEPPATSPPVRVSMLPGSAFRYSGSHYAVLEQLLEDVTGTGFADLMAALALDPLGMADSSFDQQFPHRRSDVAIGHHLTGTPLPGGWRVQPERAGAGLWTTPSDLTLLGAEIARAAAGRSGLLSRDLAEQMLTPQVPGGYGLGTHVDEHGGRVRFGHTGGNAGYCCWSFTWPDTGASVAVMTNNDAANEVLSALIAAAEVHYGRPRRVEAVAVTGAYRLREDYLIRVGSTDGHLTATVAGQPPLPPAPLPDCRFRVVDLSCELTFTDDAVEVRQEGVTLTAPQVGP